MTTPGPEGATRPTTTSAPRGGTSVGGNFSEWADLVPKNVPNEDALSADENARVWDALYKHANLATANETEKRAVRAAVYVYCTLNGTSREGNYNSVIQTSSGHNFPAAVISRAASRFKIRKFLRANMIEAYRFLKETRVMEGYERFISACARHGVSPEDAFATADFLADCPEFTPSEAKAHSSMFTYSVERARRAREGKSLEKVEGSRVEEELEAGGPMNETATNGYAHW